MILNKLITGKYSLPMTFWGWGFCLCLCLSVFKYLAIHTSSPYLIPLRFLLQSVVLAMVLSGIVFIIKRDKTILGFISLLVVFLYLLLSLFMPLQLFHLFYI